MKISLRWLSDMVQWVPEYDPWKKPDSITHIADRLTQSTAEVEHIEHQGTLLTNTCVGKILSVHKHPNADKLSICEVQTDKGKKRVVCGGTNLHQGMYVAFAHIGATVRWHGEELTTLQKTSIRGEESEGMICAAEELGLSQEFPESTGRNIIDLRSGNIQIGQPLKELLGLDDTVFHIDNHAITHRPDLFSHIGFARECVALDMAKWKKVSEPRREFPKTPVPFRLHIEERHLMSRYCACSIEIDSVGTTPDWMKQRLSAVGWRSVSLPVDITNFVASEVGIPLHSFDLDDLNGDIHMRKARKNEKITTLDKKEFSLPDGALVLSDKKGIFDLLGIMGGLRSSTKESTRRIYLHAASLDPVSIRRTVIATGHRTDAATVYEKGVPHITTEQGFFRALHLFLQFVPGARITSRMESVGNNGKPRSIILEQLQLEKTIGVSIPPKEVTRIFTNLGFTIKKKPTSYIVTPPLWRLRDCTAPHDLTEEVARIYGYNRIPALFPNAPLALPHQDLRKNNLRLALREAGCYEVMPSPFVSPTLLQKSHLDPKTALSIENPLGEETSLLQSSTIPQLLVHAEKNILFADSALQTFTIAHVFDKEKTEYEELGLICIPKHLSNLTEHPILRLSSIVNHILEKTGCRCEISSQSSSPLAHPGRSGEILVQKKPIGILGQIHPTICSSFGLPPLSAFSSINLTTLLNLAPTTPFSSPLPEFPAITYDLTIPWNHQKSSTALLEKLQSSSSLLEHILVQDIFAKNSTDPSFHLTLRCVYRSKERTLTENEAKTEHQRLTKIAHIS